MLPEPPVSHASSLSDASLLVRGACGRYLPATAEQSLLAARQVVGRKMQRGANFGSPAEVNAYLTAKAAASTTGCLQSCFSTTASVQAGFHQPEALAFTATQASVTPRSHSTVCSSRRMRAPNRLIAHVTLDDSVALDVGKVCFAVGWRKG